MNRARLRPHTVTRNKPHVNVTDVVFSTKFPEGLATKNSRSISATSPSKISPRELMLIYVASGDNDVRWWSRDAAVHDGWSSVAD